MRRDLMVSFVFAGILGLALLGCDQTGDSSDSKASNTPVSPDTNPVTESSAESSQPQPITPTVSPPDSVAKIPTTITGQTLSSTGKIISSTQMISDAGIAPAASQPDQPSDSVDAEPRIVSMEGLPRQYAPGLSWITPPDWTLKGGSNLRYVSFDPPDGEDIEILIMTFAGRNLNMLSNVNGWRRQLGLGPVSESDLPNHVHLLNNALEEVKLVDISNVSGTRMLISSLYDTEKGFTFFIRLHNDTKLVTKYEPDYLALVRTLQLEK